jgi:hypothetical protein
MTQRKALELWETKISNCEVTPQAILPIAKFLMKRDGPKAPSTIHGLSGVRFLRMEKANAIADWQIGSHHTICVTNTMKSGWKLVSKLCLKPRTTPPQKSSDLVTYKK